MADDVLADTRPLSVILRRINAVRLDSRIIFYRNAKSEIGLDLRFHKSRDKEIRKGKVVGCGIVLVSIEISENIRHVNPSEAAEHTANVVKS